MEEGHFVAVLDNFGAGSADRLKPIGRHVEIVNADLRDADVVKRAVEAWRPDLCLHLAALHFIPDCESRPATTLEVNVVGTQNLLDAIGTLATQCRVLFVSTADVYRPSLKSHKESSTVQPDNIYGLSKLAGEHLVAQFARRTGMSTTTVRLFNVYGPGETNPHVIPSILDQLGRGDRIELGNTSAKRDFIYVQDVADALVELALTSRPVSLVNLGTGRSYSIDWILRELQIQLNRTIRVSRDPNRLRPSDRPSLRADTTTLKQVLPTFKPLDLSEGLAKLLLAERLLSRARDEGTSA